MTWPYFLGLLALLMGGTYALFLGIVWLGAIPAFAIYSGVALFSLSWWQVSSWLRSYKESRKSQDSP